MDVILNAFFCQNWNISQVNKENKNRLNEPYQWSPHQIVSYCKKNNIPSIAYTYNEPTVFVEYAYEVMKLASDAKLKKCICFQWICIYRKP